MLVGGVSVCTWGGQGLIHLNVQMYEVELHLESVLSIYHIYGRKERSNQRQEQISRKARNAMTGSLQISRKAIRGPVQISRKTIIGPVQISRKARKAMRSPVNICKAIMGSGTNNGGKRTRVMDTLYQSSPSTPHWQIWEDLRLSFFWLLT